MGWMKDEEPKLLQLRSDDPLILRHIVEKDKFLRSSKSSSISTFLFPLICWPLFLWVFSPSFLLSSIFSFFPKHLLFQPYFMPSTALDGMDNGPCPWGTSEGGICWSLLRKTSTVSSCRVESSENAAAPWTTSSFCQGWGMLPKQREYTRKGTKQLGFFRELQGAQCFPLSSQRDFNPATFR